MTDIKQTIAEAAEKNCLHHCGSSCLAQARTHYIAGANLIVDMLEAERAKRARLREALEKIANIDYRGNKSTEMCIAREALKGE